MHEATVEIKGITPYSQGKHYTIPKLPKEQPKDYEARTWRERMHYDDKGVVFIPLSALKNCLTDVAKYLSMQIPGKGKATYTKHFEAGIMVVDNISLGVKKDDVEGNWLYLPSDGKRGGAKRVDKCFPIFRQWGGTTHIIVLDDTITRDVLEDHLREAGRFIGLGVYRPRNNGYQGRFEAKIVEWK